MRLLLVEDDRKIAADVERALVAAGYVVDKECKGEEAWFRGDTEDYVAIWDYRAWTAWPCSSVGERAVAPRLF